MTCKVCFNVPIQRAGDTRSSLQRKRLFCKQYKDTERSKLSGGEKTIRSMAFHQHLGRLGVERPSLDPNDFLLHIIEKFNRICFSFKVVKMSLSTGQLVYQVPAWLVHQANVGAVLLCGNWSYINWHNLIPSYRYCHMQSVDYFKPVAFMRL